MNPCWGEEKLPRNPEVGGVLDSTDIMFLKKGNCGFTPNPSLKTCTPGNPVTYLSYREDLREFEALGSALDLHFKS